MGLPVSRNEGKRTGEEAALGRRRGGGVGWGGICGLERRNRGMREGCNAETCQKRAPGPPCGMWPVCLPRKNRAGKREESEKGVKTSFAPSSWREMKGGQGGKTMSRVTEREESEVEK